MGKVLRYVLQLLGVLGVLLLCVSATASISGAPVINEFIAEPLNLLFVGFGLIGIGFLIRKYTDR